MAHACHGSFPVDDEQDLVPVLLVLEGFARPDLIDKLPEFLFARDIVRPFPAKEPELVQAHVEGAHLVVEVHGHADHHEIFGALGLQLLFPEPLCKNFVVRQALFTNRHVGDLDDIVLGGVSACLDLGIHGRVDCLDGGGEVLVDDVQDLADKRFKVQCREHLAERIEGTVSGNVNMDFLFV